MMVRHFNYSVKLVRQKEGGYTVKFFDLPEAITQGETRQDALDQAADCLEEAIANRIEMKLAIPAPRTLRRARYSVSLSATMAAKAALYITMREKHLTKVSLAKKLDCDEKEVRRLLNPHYRSKLPRIEEALHLLGQRLEIGMTRLSSA